MLSYGITHLVTNTTTDFECYSDLTSILPLKQANSHFIAAGNA